MRVVWPEHTFTDLAVLWERGDRRCILKGDGTTYELELRQGDRVVRTTRVDDEDNALALAHLWSRQEER